MGRFATRSVFAAALCAGVAMVGASVHGLVGVDAELQRSALAAAAQERTIESHSIRVTYKQQQPDWDCPGGTAEPRTSQRT
jgi:hypothetical protein